MHKISSINLIRERFKLSKTQMTDHFQKATTHLLIPCLHFGKHLITSQATDKVFKATREQDNYKPSFRLAELAGALLSSFPGRGLGNHRLAAPSAVTLQKTVPGCCG